MDIDIDPADVDDESLPLSRGEFADQFFADLDREIEEMERQGASKERLQEMVRQADYELYDAWHAYKRHYCTDEE